MLYGYDPITFGTCSICSQHAVGIGRLHEGPRVVDDDSAKDRLGDECDCGCYYECTATSFHSRSRIKRLNLTCMQAAWTGLHHALHDLFVACARVPHPAVEECSEMMSVGESPNTCTRAHARPLYHTDRQRHAYTHARTRNVGRIVAAFRTGLTQVPMPPTRPGTWRKLHLESLASYKWR